jgi:hypothetical protein
MAKIINLEGLSEDQEESIKAGINSSCSFCEHSLYFIEQPAQEPMNYGELIFKKCLIASFETEKKYCSMFLIESLCEVKSE